MEHPSTQGVYKGATIQVQKLQESRKSRKEKNDWFRIVANQSNKVLKKITWGLVWIFHYLQNTYYFSPSKDTTISNGEQSTIYTHFDVNQTCLANKLESPQQIAT